MKISVIIAVYNNKIVSEAIESILSQTYKNIEIIVIDGASTDGTLDIINKYKDKIAVLVSERDSGIYDALNKGIKFATGEVVGLLHSDDLYYDNNVLFNVAKEFENKETDAVYGDLIYVDKENANKVIRYWKAGEYKRSRWLWGWMPPHPTVYIRKKYFDEYKSYLLSLWGAADYELMLRFMYKNKIIVKYIPSILIKMSIGGQSNRNLNNRLRAHLEDREAWRINKLRSYPWTVFLKPIRKVFQYFVKP
jgi:glycosyltransferase involved in cell wall biosynthesis